MSILLRYQGPAVDDGAMDVYDAATNMMAFSDFVVAAAHKIYGNDVKVKAEVTAYKHGSFGTDLLFEVIGAAAALLPLIPDLVSVASTVKESIELYRFLKGEEPQKVEHNQDDHSVTVTNNDGNIYQVHIETLNLTLDPKAGNAIEKFVGDALSKPGINNIEISKDGETLARATAEEASYFRAIGHEDKLTDSTVRMGLTIESPSFKDGNKWKMWDGGNSLQYAMEDEIFLARIDAGERFGKGDVLICEVRVTQTKTGSKLKIERAIVKVHDHQVSGKQEELGL